VIVDRVFMKISLLADILHGRLIGADGYFERVIIDSRAVQNGDCFFAIKGETFDGHDFLEQVEKNGSVVAVVDRDISAHIPLIRVADTRKAFLAYARAHRNTTTVPVAAITGSCGKTTTRALLENILNQTGSVLASQKSFNNDIGLPLTLSQLQPTHDYVVLEIGTNHPGEIAQLSEIAQPTVATVTMAAAAHIEYFANVEAIAREKGCIFESLRPDGIAVINVDDDYADLWKTMASKHRVMTYARTHQADVMAKDIQSTPDGKTQFILKTSNQKITITLALLGEHNVMNALAAAAMAIAMGASMDAIKTGLETTAPVYGRMIEKKSTTGATIIDDTYNANPASVKAAIQLLAHRSKNSILVLGDMRELGDAAVSLHREIGELARAAGLQQLFCYGENTAHTATAFGKNAHHFSSHEALIQSLKPCVTKEVTVLIKGSRSMKMETVVNALTASA
jgi:UDP-N-acetylmuramoyl-tripeptide--D-alanyl-D-alanine ligase